MGNRLGLHRCVAGITAERRGVGGFVSLESGEGDDGDEQEAEAGEEPQVAEECRIRRFHPEVEANCLAPCPGMGDLHPDPDEEDHHADEDDRRRGDKRDQRAVGVLGVSRQVEDDENGEDEGSGEDQRAANGGQRMAVEASDNFRRWCGGLVGLVVGRVVRHDARTPNSDVASISQSRPTEEQRQRTTIAGIMRSDRCGRDRGGRRCAGDSSTASRPRAVSAIQ